MRKLLLFFFALLTGVSGVWATDWTPSISGFISVGDKVASITTASTASDNSHWYLITQVRGGESAIYDNGSQIMRGNTAATAASFNGKQAVGYASYLVRFIATGDAGIYNIQFGSGKFATSYASTPGNTVVGTSTTPGGYAFYNCNDGTGSYFGWNLGSETGKSVNNNGANNSVAFWNDGKRSGTSTEDNAIWYVYSVELEPTMTINCSSSVVKMSSQGGTNPAVFYNTSGDAQTGSAWYPKYITNTKIPVTVDCSSSTRLSNYSGNINAYGTVTMNISVPSAYRIKSYSFGAQISNANGTAATATPAGGEAVNIDGNSVASVSASNVNLSKTSITFTGTASSGTECLVNLTDFNVVIEEISSLSQSYGEDATVIINGFTGKFTRSDGGTSSTWMNQWDANDSYLPLTMRVTSNNGYTSYSYNAQNIDNISFNLASGSYGATYTLTAPSGYLIKDYTLTIMTAAQAQTITPTYPSELSGTSIAKDISSPVTIKVNRVYDKTAQFKITGTNGNLKTTNFVVTLVKDGYTPDNQIYQIVCERAGLAVASGGNTLVSTSSDELNLALSGSDLKQQFAFVQNDGKIYLYSVGEQKFVTKSKALKTYIGDPITIFPTGNSDYPYGFKFSDTELINHNSTNATIEAWGGTTTGSLDGGNCFKLNAQGVYSSISVAENKLKSVVYSLSDISQTKAYTISTDARGNWYVPSSAAAVTSTEADNEVTPSSDDPKQQFAFVKDVEGFSENYYLYSVSEKKFVTVGALEGATGEHQDTYNYNRALLGAPDLSQNVTLLASTDSKTYPSIVTVNGKNLGVSTGYTPMVIDYQSTADSGNDALIIPAIDDFDPADAQLYLLLAHVNDFIANNTGSVGFPARNTTSGSDYRTLSGEKQKAEMFLTRGLLSNNYDALLNAYNAMLVTNDIVLPQEGKTYTIANYANDGTIRYLYNNAGTIDLTTSSTITDDYKFVCHVNASGKFIFAMPNGNYFVWKGNSQGVNDAKGEVDLTTIISNSRYPLTIQKFSHKNATNLVAFGKVQIIGHRSDTQFSSLIAYRDGETNRFDHAGESNFFDNTYSSAWVITEVDDYYNKVKLSSDGTNAYASVYLPFAATIPTGIKAFRVESQDGTNAVMEEIVGDAGGTLPANTAAILKKYSQATDMDPIYLSPAEEAGSCDGTNLLEGTVVAKTRSTLETEKGGTGTIYVLGKIDDEIGLCRYTPDDLAEGKAYLFIKDATAKALTLYFGDETSLDAVKAEQIGKAPIYDLSGRRVERATRGLYIQNGKKFIVK